MTTVALQPNPGPIDAVVSVPGSKSVANRALVCAMLSREASRISGIPTGDDARVVLNVVRDSGRSITNLGNEVIIGETSVPKFPGIVDAVLAGTSSRFLTAVAALFETTSIIDGEEVLRSRPMADLHSALISLGAEISHLGEVGHLPVSVSRGSLSGGDIHIAGNVSSQFIIGYQYHVRDKFSIGMVYCSSSVTSDKHDQGRASRGTFIDKIKSPFKYVGELYRASSLVALNADIQRRSKSARIVASLIGTVAGKTFSGRESTKFIFSAMSFTTSKSINSLLL